MNLIPDLSWGLEFKHLKAHNLCDKVFSSFSILSQIRRQFQTAQFFFFFFFHNYVEIRQVEILVFGGQCLYTQNYIDEVKDQRHLIKK